MDGILNSMAGYLNNGSGIAVIVALAAGVLSSASPCTLAILPASVAYVGSVSENGRLSAVKSSLIFWLGLAVSLTVLGIVAGQLGFFFAGFGRYWYILLGGVFALLGFSIIGWVNILPDSCSIPMQRYGLYGAFIAGLIAGIASSPCATPALAAILALVALKGDWSYGALLLFVYSVGRGSLIFVAGLFAGSVTGFMKSKRGTQLAAGMKISFGVLLLLISLILFYIGF
ncbi:MAG: cytochrome c biogenesis protein CcdA [Negativicutes bacterium]|jgi:cytochrome c biogenesis protein CcdA